MKFLFDQNISHRVLKYVLDEYPESTTVKEQNLINASDRTIWDFAKTHDYIIITQDSDFNDLNSLYGFPPKIIWFRLGNLKTKEIGDFMKLHKRELSIFLEDKNYGCFEIHKLKS
ncbi:MAG: DUF5615 family PIN-like protein [Flavobacterium sp.]